jgi:hypothetical protein
MDQEILTELSDLLRHPFVLAVTTALLAGMIVNGLTRRWQDRQKALEIRTDLVAKMSESAISAILAVDRAASVLQQPPETHDNSLRPETLSAPDRKGFLEELRQSRSQWQRESAVLGTKLEVYFPSESASKSHLGVSAGVWTEFADQLSRLLEQSADWKNWEETRLQVLGKKARLINWVLREPIPAYKGSWFPDRMARWLRVGGQR